MHITPHTLHTCRVIPSQDTLPTMHIPQIPMLAQHPLREHIPKCKCLGIQVKATRSVTHNPMQTTTHKPQYITMCINMCQLLATITTGPIVEGFLGSSTRSPMGLGSTTGTMAMKSSTMGMKSSTMGTKSSTMAMKSTMCMKSTTGTATTGTATTGTATTGTATMGTATTGMATEVKIHQRTSSCD
ncbi:uncharacterized protein LOC144934679 [Lampetra fluviatilis]